MALQPPGGPRAANGASCDTPPPVSTASETGSDYHPIFFNQDRLLEELFCVCIQLLNKTWKEMRATQEDFDKVRMVATSQKRAISFE